MIARSLRAMGRPRAAYLFAKEAAQIAFPHQDILFIDTNVYKWMALDELGASAFYVHDYRTGYLACDYLLRGNRLPSSEVGRVQQNHAAYAQKLREIGQFDAVQGEAIARATQQGIVVQQPKPQLPLANIEKRGAYIPPRAARFKERK